MIASQLTEEELEFYSSLSESTIYLIGDPDLITLWEDRHSRGGLAAKLMAGKNKNYTVDKDGHKNLGSFDNAHDALKAGIESGTARQNRNMLKDIRRVKKQLNSSKDHDDKRLAGKLGQTGNGKGIELSGNYYEHKKENNFDKHGVMSTNKTTHIYQPLKQRGNLGQMAAASLKHQQAYFHNSEYNADDTAKNKFTQHEKQHLRDHLWVKKHLGEKASRKLTDQQTHANFKAMTGVDMKPYYRSAYEKTAHLVGAHTHGENDNKAHERHQGQIQHILARGAKGHDTPTTKSQILRQSNLRPDTPEKKK